MIADMQVIDGGWTTVQPVIQPELRNLCTKPYPLHPGGCPNWGKRPSCPPDAPLLGKILRLRKPVWAIWNIFNYKDHVERMKALHPKWSDHQAQCVLYWQGKARLALKLRIAHFYTQCCKDGIDTYYLKTLMCPEACGVNVTETMKPAGLLFQWPPREWAIQVALVGFSKSAQRGRRK